MNHCILSSYGLNCLILGVIGTRTWIRCNFCLKLTRVLPFTRYKKKKKKKKTRSSIIFSVREKIENVTNIPNNRGEIRIPWKRTRVFQYFFKSRRMKKTGPIFEDRPRSNGRWYFSICWFSIRKLSSITVETLSTIVNASYLRVKARYSKRKPFHLRSRQDGQRSLLELTNSSW